jgi:hypothetical protein
VEPRCGSDSSPSSEPCSPRSSHDRHPAPSPFLPTRRSPAAPTRRLRNGPQPPTPPPPAKPSRPESVGRNTRPGPHGSDPIRRKAPPPRIPRPEHTKGEPDASYEPMESPTMLSVHPTLNRRCPAG